MSRRAPARPLLVSTAPAPGAKKTPKKLKKTEKKATIVDAIPQTRAKRDDDPPENESNRLREQLLRVLVDHQRQEEEIVALRALARSLKEEVELIHKQQQHTHSRPPIVYNDQHEKRPHEFFKLDLQLEQLRSENAQLRDELRDTKDEVDALRVFMRRELPQSKIAAVQANAELECVKSQLVDERAHCDRLEAQVARYMARSSAPSVPVGGLRKQPDTNFKNFKDTEQQAKHATRDARRREREQFLLQCRLSAVKGDGDKENSDGGNGELSGTVDACRRRPSPASSVMSSGNNSSSSLSSRVHRDLSVLDRELEALQHALT